MNKIKCMNNINCMNDLKRMNKINLFRGRKAVVFNALIVVFTIIVLTFAFIRLTEKVNKVDMEIGEAPLKIVAQIQDGEKALIFLDFASNMALYQAIFDLQSGQATQSECGTYYGFDMWNTGTGETCFLDADEIEEELKAHFTSNLVARVSAYPNADFVGRSSAIAYSRGDSAVSAPAMGLDVSNTPSQDVSFDNSKSSDQQSDDTQPAAEGVE